MTSIITGRNEVLAKVMFLHVCVILLTGGYLTRHPPPLGPGSYPPAPGRYPLGPGRYPPLTRAGTPQGPGRYPPMTRQVPPSSPDLGGTHIPPPPGTRPHRTRHPLRTRQVPPWTREVPPRNSRLRNTVNVPAGTHPTGMHSCLQVGSRYDSFAL